MSEAVTDPPKPQRTNGDARSMALVIETLDLSKKFHHVDAVRSLNLRICEGTVYGFVGPNGAGKTTTIRLLLGLLQPSSGQVRIFDQPLQGDTAELRRQIGVVPEGLALFDYLTGWEYLTFVGKMFELDDRVIRSRGAELFNLTELEESASQLVVNYSFGMKKKLAFAAALLHEPKLLILDEPFEGIDPMSKMLLEKVLEALVAHGVTVFLTSHALDMVQRLCTEVGIINGGELVAAGAMSDIMNKAGNLERLFFQNVLLNERRRRMLSWLK
jgi:ABC-2 type transport system ATP-binding protein